MLPLAVTAVGFFRFRAPRPMRAVLVAVSPR